QAPAPSGGSATTDGPAKRVVKRVVLPDGAIQFEYSDGTKRRVSSKPGIPSTLTDAEEGNDTAGSGRAPDEIAPTMPPVWLKDPATNNRFLKAMGEYYDYRSSGLEHRRRVFEWQLFSSKIIFVTVLTLVGAGIVFAALQD